MNSKSDLMHVSQAEAKEALEAIQSVSRRTRHSIADSSVYIFLIVNGFVWLIGFLCNQFVAGKLLGYIWLGLVILAVLLSILLGIQMARRLRAPSMTETGKRIGLLWLFLTIFCAATLFVANPTDGRQITMVVILFVLLGVLSMGLLISFTYVWWALPISALALACHLLIPEYFYLGMGILVGGGAIVFAFYIRSRW
jgi:hypothetical protein